MAWEATQLNSPRRLRLAQLVLRERAQAVSPAAALQAEPDWLTGLLEPAAAADQQESLEAIDLF